MEVDRNEKKGRVGERQIETKGKWTEKETNRQRASDANGKRKREKRKKR